MVSNGGTGCRIQRTSKLTQENTDIAVHNRRSPGARQRAGSGLPGTRLTRRMGATSQPAELAARRERSCGQKRAWQSRNVARKSERNIADLTRDVRLKKERGNALRSGFLGVRPDRVTHPLKPLKAKRQLFSRGLVSPRPRDNLSNPFGKLTARFTHHAAIAILDARIVRHPCDEAGAPTCRTNSRALTVD